MRALRLHPLAVCLALAGVFPAAHAAQSTVGVGTLTNGTTFSVRYVVDKFVAVNGSAPGIALGMDVPISISTATLLGPDGATGIKNFSVWLKVHAQDAFGQTSFDAHKTTRTNPYSAIGGQGYVGYPTTQNADVQVNVPLSAMLQTAAARCNAKLSSLMAAGMTREQAISQNQTITLAVQPVLRYELFPTNTVTDESNRPWSEFRKIDIVCESPGTGPQARGTTSTTPGGTKPGKGPALLTQVDLALQQPPSPTQCPAEITANMTFRASAMGDDAKPLAPGHFSYRMRSASGRVSKSDVVLFQESDRQGLVFVKTIQQKFSVPLPAMGGGGAPAPGLGGVAQGAAGALAPGLGAGGGFSRPGAADNFASGGAPAPANVHADTLWVDITGGKAGSVQKSGYANYSVTCQYQPTQTGAGGVAATPGSQAPTTHPTNPPQRGGAGVVQLPGSPNPAPIILPPASRVPATSSLNPGAKPSANPSANPGTNPDANPSVNPSTNPRATPTFPPPSVPTATTGNARPVLSAPAGTRTR